MSNLSNKKLERIAVDAVNAEVNRPNFHLAANIPVGDKGISFDGDIEVFKDGSESVESLVGKVPIQVKGYSVSEFSKGNITFSMGLDHLRNYYNSQGVVIFVVEIKGTGDSKIYYKQLLSTELREIIKIYGEVKKQKERVVELRPLSETNIDIVCRKFLHESKKQPSVFIEHNPFKENDFNDFSLTSLTFNPGKKETSNIFEHDFILYGIKESLNVPLRQGRIHSYTTSLDEEIKANGNKYNFNLEVTEEKNRIIYLFENSLELILYSKEGKFNFSINKFNSLSVQLKIVPFILDFITGTSISFLNLSRTLENIIFKDSKKLMKIFSEQLETLKRVKKVFDLLGIPETIEFNDTTGNLNDFFDQVTSFAKIILDNDFSNFNIVELDIAKFTLLRIGNLEFVLFYNPDSETKLTNAFSKELLLNDTRVIDENNNSYPHSPYIMLNASALANGVNVDLGIIKKSFDSFNPFFNQLTTNITNEFCLSCINAYDLSKNKELLTLANYIYSKYKGEYIDENIIFINRAQINKRLNNDELSGEEINKLIMLRQSEPNNIELQFCTSVLLESKFESKIYFEKMDKSVQEFYRKLPILTLAQYL